jgi:hypothetical protein
MKRGVLTVEKLDDFYFLNFPSDNPIEIDIPIFLKNAFNYTPTKVLRELLITCLFSIVKKQ